MGIQKKTLDVKCPFKHVSSCFVRCPFKRSEVVLLGQVGLDLDEELLLDHVGHGLPALGRDLVLEVLHRQVVVPLLLDHLKQFKLITKNI